MKQRYKCPSCLILWDADVPLNESSRDIKIQECEFCSRNKPISSLQLLHRRLDILDETEIMDFPVIIKHLVKHLDLKHRDE